MKKITNENAIYGDRTAVVLFTSKHGVISLKTWIFMKENVWLAWQKVTDLAKERSYENETSRGRNIPISRKLWDVASKYCVVTTFLIFYTVFRTNFIGAAWAHTFHTKFHMSSRGGTAVATYLPCDVFASSIDVNTFLFWECFNIKLPNKNHLFFFWRFADRASQYIYLSN